MPTDVGEQIRELGRRWADAQQRGDAEALDAFLSDDFKLVGPLGFVLDKQQWLDQHRSGALVMSSVQWDDVDVRAYADAAIAIAIQTPQAAYAGRPADGRFRVTHLALRSGESWTIAGAHFSPIAERP